MAFLKLDNKNLTLTLIVGVKEKYEPREDVIEVSNKAEALKKKTNDFIKSTWGEKSTQDIAELFKKDSDEKKKWIDFLQNVYNQDLQHVLTTIDNVNKVICPNYEDIKGEKE